MLILCVDRNCCADLNDNDIQIIEHMIKISEFDKLLSNFKAFALKLLDVYTSVEHYQTIQSNEFDVLKRFWEVSLIIILVRSVMRQLLKSF